ncbi:MAG: phosphoribosylamine--glycine ligase [Bacteroidales bacterium]|nr:phosphoribosylamine--glycine ligase [Bacteroidales bacterium]MDY5442490.1 phosphoribosylamine--glycine ligase [Candidatus Cryptobacteroides sp.]
MDTNTNKARVLVVGGGGREHAIVDALSRSSGVGKIFCAPGNAGIAMQAECVPIKDTNVAELADFAEAQGIDLTVVGPESALAAGIVDEFESRGLKIFGPSKAAAVIESSKDFAKALMARHNVPTAAYRTFSSYDEALAYVREGKFPVVLKYDGLAAGKGVVIVENLQQADETLRDMLLDDRFGHGKVVVEEFLTGPEFSFLCFVNGKEVVPMILAQDHKRAFDGDEGPNTGGMGAYTGLPFVNAEDEEYALEHIMKPVAAGMSEEGIPFRGVLYGGLMKTPDGIKVIEFNCRFGDPETEVVLPALESDIYDIFLAVAEHRPIPDVKWDRKPYIGFVLASRGYPGSYAKGFEIKGLKALPDDVKVYHMGTSLALLGEGHEDFDGTGRSLVTSGGRVLMVLAGAPTLSEARDKAMDAVNSIDCDNLFHRTDIGHWAL